jgi:hypothetical protein
VWDVFLAFLGLKTGQWFRRRHQANARALRAETARASMPSPFKTSVLDRLPSDLAAVSGDGLRRFFVATTLAPDSAEEVYASSFGERWTAEHMTRAPLEHVLLKPERDRLYVDVRTYEPQLLYVFILVASDGMFASEARARIHDFANALTDQDPWTEIADARG